MPVKRIAFYLFFDADGKVDDYVVHALNAFGPHFERLVVVCNGSPTEEGLTALEKVSSEILIRENEGFDVGGYKEALLQYGKQRLMDFDEVVLMNYTFYAPIFPLSEMFDRMGARKCDFWGISSHKECISPFGGGETLAFHIQSHFIAVRARLIGDDAFWDYWKDMPQILSYSDSVVFHEARFTDHFSRMGYEYSVLLEPNEFESDHPVFVEIDKTIENRCPILKRRPLFHDPMYLESEAIDVRRAIDLIETCTDYPVEMIWRNIVRAAAPRTLYTNLEQLSILPDIRMDSGARAWEKWSVAVIVHLYYPDMAMEINERLEAMPIPVDVFVTTDSHEKKLEIENIFRDAGNRHRLEVRVVFSNYGRDTSALLIACKDIVCSKKYDLICRLHGKRSPQDGPSRGRQFKRHLYENLLSSTGYIENVLDLFAKRPYIGIAMPTVVHIGYPTLGHAWFTNKTRVERLAEEMGLTAIFDTHTPLAPLGSMYWFRPDALVPIFEKAWEWREFDERSYGDGDLPHAIERLIPYVAQCKGYLTWCVMTQQMAAKNYVQLEYKYQVLSSCFPMGEVRGQVALMLQRASPVAARTIKMAWQDLADAFARSLKYRWGRIFENLRRRNN